MYKDDRYNDGSYGRYEGGFDREGYIPEGGAYDSFGGYDDTIERQQPHKKKKGFFDSFKNTTKQAESLDEFSPYAEGSYPNNVIISSPKTYADVQTLIDSLKHRQPLIVDLAQISDDGAQRILDFMSGAIYALSGSMHRITGGIFLLTPEGMSIKIPVELKTALEKKK